MTIIPSADILSGFWRCVVRMNRRLLSSCLRLPAQCVHIDMFSTVSSILIIFCTCRLAENLCIKFNFNVHPFKWVFVRVSVYWFTENLSGWHKGGCHLRETSVYCSGMCNVMEIEWTSFSGLQHQVVKRYQWRTVAPVLFLLLY
jgi:hypothetical protein